MMLAYLLHAANRNIRSYTDAQIKAFYEIKDHLLKTYAKEDGYDIQKIPGKKCHSCGGAGSHPRYSSTPPYNVYDWNDCWHCFGGWYRFPKWICLQRYTWNGYHFHRPLKREECISNPFTTEKMGWQVTDQPVIQGYIEHNKHRFGKIAALILFLMYNRPVFKSMLKDEIRWKKNKFRWWIQDLNRWRGWIIIDRPSMPIRFYYDDNFTHCADDDSLPF